MRFFQFIADLILLVIRMPLPKKDSLAEYLDYIIPYVKRFSEGLNETEYYLDKQLKEVTDDLNKTDKIIHIFQQAQTLKEIKTRTEDEGAPYLYSLDGKITKGKWVFIQSSALIIKLDPHYDLYDLCFLNEDFMVLRLKTATAAPSDYLFLVNDKLAKDHTWLECIEFLYDVYRYNFIFMLLWFGFFIVVTIVMYSSLR